MLWLTPHFMLFGIACLIDDRAVTEESNRRRFPRSSVDAPGGIAWTKRGDRQSENAFVDSVSPLGASIHMPAARDLPLGTHVDFYFKAGEEQRFDLAARIVWTHPDVDGGLRAGLELMLNASPAGQRRNFANWVVLRLTTVM